MKIREIMSPAVQCVQPEDNLVEAAGVMREHDVGADKTTLARARQDARDGKSPSTQAGEFIRAEIERVRHGRHGIRNTRQAIAIGLSEARRAGVKLPPPKQGKTSAATRRKAQTDTRRGQSKSRQAPSRKRAQATTGTLKRKGRHAASHQSLSRQARTAAKRRGKPDRARAARKAARTRHRRSMG